jgi:hypothetical protein
LNLERLGCTRSSCENGNACGCSWVLKSPMWRWDGFVLESKGTGDRWCWDYDFIDRKRKFGSKGIFKSSSEDKFPSSCSVNGL